MKPGRSSRRNLTAGFRVVTLRNVDKRPRPEAIKRRDKGEETLAEIGRSYNVSGATISRLAV